MLCAWKSFQHNNNVILGKNVNAIIGVCISVRHNCWVWHMVYWVERPPREKTEKERERYGQRVRRWMREGRKMSIVSRIVSVDELYLVVQDARPHMCSGALHWSGRWSDWHNRMHFLHTIYSNLWGTVLVRLHRKTKSPAECHGCFINTLGSITGRVPMEQPGFTRVTQRHKGYAAGAPLFRVWPFSLPALRRNELNPFIMKLQELNPKCTMNALYRISRSSCLHEFI